CVVISTSAHSGGAANSAAPVHRLCWRVPCEEDRADGQRNAGEAVEGRQGRRGLKRGTPPETELGKPAVPKLHWSGVVVRVRSVNFSVVVAEQSLAAGTSHRGRLLSVVRCRR